MHKGTYVENVDVDKQVTLIGDGADVVTVRAANVGDHVFGVTADYVKIGGFTVTGTTGSCKAGIHLDNVDYCNISKNRILGNEYGIYLWDSNNNTLSDNTANSNGWCGIDLSYSSGNTLQNNTMSGNGYNFGVHGSSLLYYIQNIDARNTVDGRPIYYWIDEQDKQIPYDAGFVGIVDSTNITVRNLALTNNSHGVLFISTDNSRIEGVTASDNWYGIYMLYSANNTLSSNTANSNDEEDGIHLEWSSNNTLQSNIANSNSDRGIGLFGSDNNTLQDNTALDNWCGVHLWSSTNNTLYHSNLANNTWNNAFDEGSTNQWDSGSEGNYYSDYTGTDTNKDGIGDIPYDIPGNQHRPIPTHATRD